jgi:N-acetylglutamate synthase-like GNAT family acetyltransferase
MTSFVLKEDIKKAKEFLKPFHLSSKPSWTAASNNIKVGQVLKTENGKIVSAIIYEQLKQNEHWVFIHALATREDARNRGHARKLLENLMKEDRAPHMICLEALNGNSDLLQIFWNFGFIPSSTHDEEIKKDINTLGIGNNKTLVLDNKA